MGLTIAPDFQQQLLTNAGAVLAGGSIHTYAAGTDDDLATYSDEAGTVENENPILLNSAGRPWNGTSEINVYCLPRSYKFVIANAAGEILSTKDHIPAVPTLETSLDIAGTAGEALAIREIAYLSAGDGGRTAGRWYKTDADNDYASSTAGMVAIVTAAIASGDTAEVFRLQGRVTGFTALVAGSDYYVSATAGGVTATAPVNARFVGQADSTTSLVVSPNPASATQAATVEIDGTGGEALAAGDLAYLSDGSNALTAGRWYKADADLYYASIHPELGFVPVAISSGAMGKIRVGGAVTLSGLTAGATYYVSATAGGVTATAPANARSVGVAISTTVLNIAFSPQWLANGDPLSICDGRLTLTTGTPVTTADVTAATTVYYAPYRGNRIALFDGSKWKVYSFSELSIAVPATTVTVYDVFAYDNAGTLTLELTAWTNDTTRATALTTQNGVLVKTGATTRRYLGSCRTTGVSGQTEDSLVKRFVWNYYHRVPRAMRRVEGTDSWTYTTATFQQANADAANQLDLVVGVAEVPADVTLAAISSNDNANVARTAAIGYDSTTTPVTGGLVVGRSAVIAINDRRPHVAKILHYPDVGRHVYTWLEASAATGTTTWYGDNGGASDYQAGITGWIEG